MPGQLIKQSVNPIGYPLKGSSLIEASAGTGKTWTIAALYLRLVLGHQTVVARLPEEILVLTFTKAAARELKDRIRQRLAEAADFFRGLGPGDAYLIELKNSIPAQQHAYSAYLLSMASQSMDMAAISTIHSWCDKALRQHAFESGSLFDLSLTEDTSLEKHYSVWDYWRRHIATLPADLYAKVIKVWSGPSALKNLVRYVNPDNLPELDNTDLDLLLEQMFNDRNKKLAELKKYWRLASVELLNWLEGLGKSLKRNKNDYARWAKTIADWANSDTDTLDLGTGWQRFSEEQINEKYTGENLQIIPVCAKVADLEQELAALPDLKEVLYRHAFVCLSKNLHQNLADKSALDFDGLLIQMEQALNSQNGSILAQTLRQQYPVIMVDEFQDTDPVQYSIFNKIYQVKENRQDITAIFIGDPKQSIYRFRGADIYTYINAAQDCGQRIYTLNRNFRSAANMVSAVNEFFTVSNKPVFITADENRGLDFIHVQANGLDEKFLINGQPVAAISGLWLDDNEENINITEFRDLAAHACANEIARLLNLAHEQQAIIKKGDSENRLKPADIAILVNSSSEARLIQRSLNRAGIRSVYLSEKTNVYESRQAKEVKLWLAACIEPLNIRAVSAALASPSFGISYKELFNIKNDERSFDSYIERFIKYKNIWQKRGVLPMLYKLLHEFSVPAILLADDTGERALTNFLHLADLLQNASINLDGPQALLHYLNQQISDKVQNDANLLRLESDDDLIRITTIHKSKGLEYPLVFLPFISAGKEKPAPDLPIKFNQENGPEWLFALNKNLADRFVADELGEEVRKLYVAITRARHAVWLALKNDSSRRLSGLSHVFDNNTKSSFDKLCQLSVEQFDWAKKTSGDLKLIPASTDNLPKKQIQALDNPAVKENWWISSYSALHLGNLQLSDSLSFNLFEDELAGSANIDEYAINSVQNYEQALLNIPRGSSTGTFLHGILQAAANSNFDKSVDLRDLIARRCAVRGWQAYIDDLYSWLTGFLNNDWHIDFNNTQFKFNDLKSSYAELEFLMPVKKLNTATIDRLISSSFYPGYDRPSLSPQQLNGMFKGYIDLCFQNQDGLYYVLDYKSNYLDEYTDHNIVKSMLAMRYDVQMLIYALVLHKQLKMRLPDYDYERDFGGAVYLYLRGQAYPSQGLISFKPELDLLNSLESVFADNGVNTYV